ncbi:MAG: type II secretion system protein [Acidobacteria bacterium]|nr:MAG: type II secretion system protein [Acidobacteriota bacterium]
MRNKKGFSVMELLISVAVISVISALVVPTFLQSKIAANEALAIRAVGNVVASQISYSMTMGSGSYTTDLKVLQKAGLNEDLVGSGISGGYVFSISGSHSEFKVQARPLVFGSTGTRSFYSDQTGIIRYTETDGMATSSSLALNQNEKTD